MKVCLIPVCKQQSYFSFILSQNIQQQYSVMFLKVIIYLKPWVACLEVKAAILADRQLSKCCDILWVRPWVMQLTVLG